MVHDLGRSITITNGASPLFIPPKGGSSDLIASRTRFHFSRSEGDAEMKSPLILHYSKLRSWLQYDTPYPYQPIRRVVKGSTQ